MEEEASREERSARLQVTARRFREIPRLLEYPRPGSIKRYVRFIMNGQSATTNQAVGRSDDWIVSEGKDGIGTSRSSVKP
jgi:hypothetical protein